MTVNLTCPREYCAIHAIAGDSDSAGEQSASNIYEFTEATTLVPVISAQEGTSGVWNGNGLVAKAIRWFKVSQSAGTVTMTPSNRVSIMK